MNMNSTMVNNGVNVAALAEAREAFDAAPEAARFDWHAQCDWVYGTHARSSVYAFEGAGGPQQHRTRFTFDTDHPEVFAAEDNGATPVEYVLVGLAGCLTAGVASVAQNRNIKLNRVTANVTGSMDLQGILGVDSEVRNGFDDVRVEFDIDADATPEEIEALVAQSQKRSAVFDVITNSANVEVSVK